MEESDNQETSTIDLLSDLRPGSIGAQLKGCTCPVLDNNCGLGYNYYPGISDKNIIFVQSERCPLHGCHLR